MRLTSKEVDKLLEEINLEDPAYQVLLINDRFKHLSSTNPDLLIRLIEAAWDEVFGFDPKRAFKEKMDYDHLAFYNVKDRLFRLMDNGYDTLKLVRWLGLRENVFKCPEVDKFTTGGIFDNEAFSSEYSEWRNKFLNIITLQKLIEIHIHPQVQQINLGDGHKVIKQQSKRQSYTQKSVALVYWIRENKLNRNLNLVRGNESFWKDTAFHFGWKDPKSWFSLYQEYTSLTPQSIMKTVLRDRKCFDQAYQIFKGEKDPEGLCKLQKMKAEAEKLYPENKKL